MKSKRRILFRIGAIVLLLAIASIMMVIERGHSIYLDNKAIDYDGQTYEALYKAVVFVDGEQIAKLYDKERGLSTCIGQKFDMTLEIMKEEGGGEETSTVTLTVPYGMDGVAINLPAFLAGLPEEAYLSKFQPAIPEVEEETDDINLIEEPVLDDL